MTEAQGDGQGMGQGVGVAALPVVIDIECCSRVNFALQQNRVPMVGRVSLTNVGEGALENLRVRVELSSGEAEAWECVVGRVGPGETYGLEPDGPRLEAGLLAGRTERERVSLVVTVEAGGEGDSEAGGETSSVVARAEHREEIDLLPFDHWGGLSPCPELLAAFVTPNHPGLAPVLGGAREVLRGRDESDAIDGYQSGNRSRAVMLGEACFAALARHDIGYINPPASFERAGQRVRLVDQVLRERLGTCLDLSLVLCGLWEQAGLNPLVILFGGHALPAFWTHDEHFAEPVLDEVARVRKGVELGELVVVESTVLTHEGGSFAGAVEAARRKLGEAASAHAVDIRTARRLGIRPLPLRVEESGTSIAPEAVSVEGERHRSEGLAAVELAERAEALGGEDRGEGRPADRVDRWKRKLLDLSLRNRLLSFRDTNRSLGLGVPELGVLEDALADGKSFDILPRPGRGAGEAEMSDEAAEAFRAAELGEGRLFAESPEGETAKKLLEMYRASRSSIEETGANVLFLALGMLHWYEVPGAEKVRRAPLILLPVRLVRRSAGGGYRYRVELTSEPLRPNITLLEKLRVDFGMDVGGLDSLPEDERGIDVPMILRRFCEAIRDAKGWEVVESAHLGLFSFNKFLMWYDLQQHRERLGEQRLVRHLIDRDGEFEAGAFPEAGRLDEELAPGALLCTRDADSSQMVAVRAAGQGRTFVLEGPPGTGKSQTIANIIADGLARGRRVLFVAEKMAALSVVRRRLEQDGLGPFALELHSAKASKKAVLRQLGEALDVARSVEPGEWAGTCEGLSAARGRLNEYVGELHEERASGESVYQMIGRLGRLGDGARVELGVEDCGAVGAAELGAWRDGVASLAAAAEAVDPVGAHPLRGIGRGEWSFGLPDEARRVIDRAARALGAVSATVGAMVDGLGVESGEGVAGGLSQVEVRALCEASAMLGACPRPERELLRAGDIGRLAGELGEWIARGRENDRRAAVLLGVYRPELFEADLLGLLDGAKQAVGKPGIVRWFFAGGVRKRLRPWCVGAAGSLERVVADLEEAVAVVAERRELAKPGIEPAACFGREWKGGEADWDELDSVLRWAVGFVGAVRPMAGTDGGRAVAAALIAAASDPELAPVGESAVGRDGSRLVEAWNGWSSAWGSLREVLVADGELAWGSVEGGAWTRRAGEVLERWGESLSSLNDWCAWRREREAAIGAGLGAVVEALETGVVARGELGDVFERSFGEKWLVRVADASEAIRTFNARAHAGAVGRFRELDESLIGLARVTVAAKLAERLPGLGASVAASSEVGILRRELEKRSRHLPTRRLIELLPNLLPRLKPCFLMSPLSVAQYLDPGLPPFDLVVFDEASQIPVWDAIGSIARGTEVIVVGDSKQLPPTNFFNTMESEDDDAGIAAAGDDELESILQECNASGVPGLRLQWHYRSRHESLIAFSNHHYYDNELHTFPSPTAQSAELGVSFHAVEGGVYDRGGTRTNRVEAAAVVGEVLRRLAEPDATGSIGIVTFNAAQQGLIEDMLDEARREHPEIERFFAGEGAGVDDPVFIKNLENVQGDERDTIIFSVGYGPDEGGRVSMNFGPLNTDGGERRLNVAITRARYRLLVFCSMPPDAIDLSRTRAIGVRHFRRFLEYAQRGPGAIAEAAAAHPGSSTPSEFERVVRDAVVARGWEVDARVGCAGYRVDLAVRDPDCAGRYLLGIECDGPMYAGASTARDRDRTRGAVLEGLGWRLVRVWAPAWRIDREGCIARIEEAIAGASDGGSGGGEEQSGRGEEGELESSPAALLGGGSGSGSEGAAEGAATTSEVPVYAPARRPRGVSANADIFEDRITERAVRALVVIVEQEGPIVPELALRRLADWFGVARITDRYRERFGEVLGRAAAGGAVFAVGDAFWAAGADAAGYDEFRACGEDEESRRDIEWVPLVERAAAVRQVLRAQIGLPREDLEREAARLLGVQRATAKTREVMGEAIDEVVGSGFAIEVDGRVAIAE